MVTPLALKIKLSFCDSLGISACASATAAGHSVSKQAAIKKMRPAADMMRDILTSILSLRWLY